MTDYTRLRQLAENATPGPWGYEGSDNSYDWNAFVYTELGGGRTVAGDASDVDAQFIAAANPDAILRLLDELATAYDRGCRETYEWILARQNGMHVDEPTNPYREDTA